MDPKHLLISVTAAVIPSLLLFWYFYSKDKNPEPAHVLLITFGLGILIVIPVLVVAIPVLFFVLPTLLTLVVPGLEANSAYPLVAGVSMAFLVAAIPEEFFKWLVVVGYCMRHKEFDEPMDGIIYGVVASLGFATLENVLYVVMAGENAMTVALARAFTAVPCHAFLGAIMGYFVSKAKFTPEKRGYYLLLAYLVPALLHGLYDFPLMVLMGEQKDNAFNFGWVGMAFGVLVLMGLMTNRYVSILRTQQLSQRNDY